MIFKIDGKEQEINLYQYFIASREIFGEHSSRARACSEIATKRYNIYIYISLSFALVDPVSPLMEKIEHGVARCRNF